VLNGGEPHHCFKRCHFINGEILDETKVEEGDFAISMKQIVAGMRIAIK